MCNSTFQAINLREDVSYEIIYDPNHQVEDGMYYVGHIRNCSDSRVLTVASGHSGVRHLASVHLAPFDRRGQNGFEVIQVLADGKLSHVGSARLGSDIDTQNSTAVVKQESCPSRPPAAMTPIEAAFEGNLSSLDDWAAHNHKGNSLL